LHSRLLTKMILINKNNYKNNPLFNMIQLKEINHKDLNCTQIEQMIKVRQEAIFSTHLKRVDLVNIIHPSVHVAN